ncbi:MAG: hypothetical protein ABFR32_11655 [Bacteroidota bacterium]
MKTKNLKHKFLFLFIVLGLTLSFNACSSDDDEPQTFLEKYDGTIWTFSGEDIYIRIIDNESIILEEWYLDNDCYEHDTLNYEVLEIIENSTDKLIIKITDDGETETFTFTIEGEVLTVVITEVDGFETVSLIKTSVNVDEFEICIN